MKFVRFVVVIVHCLVVGQAAGGLLSDRLAEVHGDFLENRREAIPSLSDPFGVPDTARIVIENDSERMRAGTPWKRNIVATVFWVGEQPTQNNPTPNTSSAWDQNWMANFGGYDDPDVRRGWCPSGFTPALNPFYIALPYNDVARGGVHRPEASEVIPWFWRDYRGDGLSVCHGKWVAVHLNGRVCYAQWEDVGPFEVDHWQYVFGNEKPRRNRNKSAGIDVSPAVRDFLGMDSGAHVEWRFVDESLVPAGPWLDWAGGVGSSGY